MSGRAPSRETLVATLVQHEPRQLGVAALQRATTSSAPAICGTRSSRTNDTASMRGTPRGRKARHQLRTHRRRERLGLVLQAVARPDIADRDTPGERRGRRHELDRVARPRRQQRDDEVVVAATPTHCQPVSVWPNLK